MELETLIIAQQVQEKLDYYKESIDHIKGAPKFLRSGSDISIYIADGCGCQRIHIPKEVANEVLDIIKKSLEKNIEKLEQQFKSL